MVVLVLGLWFQDNRHCIFFGPWFRIPIRAIMGVVCSPWVKVCNFEAASESEFIIACSWFRTNKLCLVSGLQRTRVAGSILLGSGEACFEVRWNLRHN